MNAPPIDPGVITLIQATFLDQIKAAFSITAGYASNLLYFFAAIELSVLGLIWALQRDIGWDKLFFKIIKIGMIFFIIRNYPWLLNTILFSFAKLAGGVIDSTNVAQYIFNPAKIWQYGYNVGVHLLELGSTGTLFGLTLIQVGLGVGILLVFGLLGIQMVTQTVSFYLVAFGSLILLPFGALTSGRNMFDKAVQAVLKSGLRLMVLIIIISIAMATWKEFELIELATTTNFNLNQPLGLFFTALLFLCLSIYLPKVVGEAIGDLNSNILEGGQAATTVVHQSTPVFAPEAAGGLANMQAATSIAPGTGGATGSSYEGGAGVAAAATVPTVVTSGTAGGGSLEAKMGRDAMSQASTLSKSISETTVKRIKEAVTKAIKEKT